MDDVERAYVLTYSGKKADHKGNICCIWTRWLFLIGLKIEFTTINNICTDIYIYIFFVLSDITIVIDVLHLWETIWYKVSSISHVHKLFYTCYCSSIWLHHHSIVYNLFTSILFFTLPCPCICMCYSMLWGEILSSTCRFFYGLKFCASKGRTNVLILFALASCCVCSFDGWHE